jgi:hypothetical protein
MNDATALDLILADDGRFYWATDDRMLPFICGGDGETPPADLTIPEDLTTVEDPDDLVAMRDSVNAQLDELRDRAESDPTSITSDDANRAAELNGAAQALNAEIERRAGEQQANVDAVLANTTTPEPEADPNGGDGNAPEGEPPAETPPA